jgi:hypothetical protein
MLRLPQDRTRAGAFSFLASASLPLTRKWCLLLSVGDSSHCGPHLPWLSTRPRGRHCRQWGCTCPSLFFAMGSFMWLSLGAAHGRAFRCRSGVAIVFVCLCGQWLEDSSIHYPFPKNNSFEHTEHGVLNCLNFWPPGVCLHWGGSPKPRHGIFKDMIFSTWDFGFGTYTVWVSKT